MADSESLVGGEADNGHGPPNGSPLVSTHPVITADIEVCGDISFSGRLEFHGRLQGNLSSDGEVIIGESAVIKGTVAAETADIAGKIQGDVIIAGAVTLRSDAMIFGTVKAGSMSVEEGAVVQGKILARRSDRPAQDFSNIFNRLPKHDN